MSNIRAVSLIASATEIVCALRAEELLVGRSHECDYPPSITRLPVCTEARIDASAPSAEIDRQVKSALRQALSIYEVRAELLDSLKPDLIITQAQCEVCAVSLQDVENAVSKLIGTRPRIVSLNPNGLADIWADILRVAQALDCPDSGRELVERMQQRMRQVSQRALAAGSRPSVACIEWIDPLMAAGNWVPELVEMAGGRNLFGQAGKHSPWMTWEELQGAEPDVIIVMPCGFDLPRVRREMPALTSKPGWGELRAVRTGRVHLVDGNAYFNRPGPRLVEALEMLAGAFHPSLFEEGMLASGFEFLVSS